MPGIKCLLDARRVADEAAALVGIRYLLQD
jgi:hypothetical protein